MKTIYHFLKSHTLFTVAFSLAVLSIIFGRFNFGFINYSVITTLFGMMLVLSLFEGSGFLHYGSIKIIGWSKNTRILVRNMVLLSFIGSFLLTNDVAVLTLLPIYIRMISNVPHFKGSLLGAVLIPIAANLGGVFFPFSNPQNLIIYDYYSISPFQFIRWTAPLLLIGLLLVLFASFVVEAKEVTNHLKTNEMNKPVLTQAMIGMALMILTVLGLLPVYWIVLMISIWVFLTNRKYFANVDYGLLGTFVSFFILVGNIGEWPLLNQFISSSVSSASSTYISSILLSQVLSNVPAAILVSPFTNYSHALLIGVNVGGLGTLIASLTNLIGFNIIRTMKRGFTGGYLKLFSGINLLFLFILSVIFGWLI